MSIIISQNGKDARRIEETSFEYEDNLQQYISNNPEVVPIYDVDEDINLLIVARELATDSGPIDAFGIDQNGHIYLIETKLYKNSDKRTVLAQVLDYGAALWKSSSEFDDFTMQLNNHCRQLFDVGLQEKAKTHFGLDEDELNSLLNNLKANLSDGVYKFVVLMDTIEQRLKNLILFINQNSQFDVYAVELEYYKHQNYEITIPKIHGTEVKKDAGVKSAGSNRKNWTEELFWEDANHRLNPQQLAALDKLYKWCKDEADDIDYGTGPDTGSFIVRFNDINPKYSFLIGYSDGRVRIQFWLKDNKETLEALYEALANNLQDQQAVQAIKDAKDKHSHVDLEPDFVTANVDDLIKSYQELIGEHR